MASNNKIKERQRKRDKKDRFDVSVDKKSGVWVLTNKSNGKSKIMEWH